LSHSLHTNAGSTVVPEYQRGKKKKRKKNKREKRGKAEREKREKRLTDGRNNQSSSPGAIAI
jgi:hypothetical protein